jgi:hypothetical protein
MSESSKNGLMSSKLGVSKTLQIGRVGLMVTISLLLSACSVPKGSETYKTLCRELERDLPTYSVKDTPETLESGARFIDVFNAVCGGLTR